MLQRPPRLDQSVASDPTTSAVAGAVAAEDEVLVFCV